MTVKDLLTRAALAHLPMQRTWRSVTIRRGPMRIYLAFDMRMRFLSAYRQDVSAPPLRTVKQCAALLNL